MRNSMALFLGGPVKLHPPLWFCIVPLLVACATPQAAQSPAPFSPQTGTAQTGEAILGIRRGFPARIEARSAALVFLPARDQFYLEFPYETVTYRQYWDRPARELFAEAVEAFRADLARGMPQQSAARTRRAYGRFKTRIEWGTFSFMLNYAAQPQLDLGYAIIEKTPYLTITQYAAEGRGTTPENHPTSLRISLYLTPEWAEALALRFTEDAASPPSGN
jgi:hypothetical protein